MENDLADTRIRWHSLKEEKGKTANILRDVERVEAELDRLTEEKSQVDLDEKVISLSLQIWKSWWGSKVLLREYIIIKAHWDAEPQAVAEKHYAWKIVKKCCLVTLFWLWGAET